MIPRPTSLMCGRCNQTFVVSPRGKVPRFCSPRCQKGTKVSRLTGGQCSVCGGPCGPRSLSCLRRECQIKVRSDRARRYAQDHRAKTGEWPSMKYGWTFSHEVTCLACGRTYTSVKRTAKYCNKTCWAEGTRATRQAALEIKRAKRAAAEAAAGKQLVHVGPAFPYCPVPSSHPSLQAPEPSDRIFRSGACPWCGAHFTITWPCNHAKFCTKRCAKASGKARNGHRFRISPLDRERIYERDRWICQLCHDPVDRNLPPSDVWAATLDHIECQSWTLIPDHSSINLRLAHRWCNSVRADESYHTAADLVA